VTLIEAGPCYVTQIRQVEKDGYRAIQLGFEEVKPKRITSGQLGHLKRNVLPGQPNLDLPPLRFLREFRIKPQQGAEGQEAELQEGDSVTVAVFEVGEKVDVVGTSKGKGFQGGMKRYGFRGGPATHGQSDRQRSPGSRGSTSTPGRVYKGSRGPGHMGDERVTTQNLKVVLVDPERNLLGLRGAVPGPRGGVVLINGARKV
jgi:large subunit ribosomal protein L3